MSFKKILPEVIVALQAIQIESLNQNASTYFAAIKSGKHTWVNAPQGSGKTTVALTAIFNKVNKEYEGSPRAIYLTSTIDKAEQLHKSLRPALRKLDVTADLVHDKGNMVQQRNDIFDGTEIVVGNPKRVFDLYLQNGINFKLLELFVIDDLEECLAQGRVAELKRMIESLEAKTQIIFLSNEITKKTQAFMESLEFPMTIIDEAIN